MRTVFTNGVFDLIHPGHIHLLTQAKQLGDWLIVAINSDTSAQQIKRLPRFNQHHRKTVLEALRAVDEVIVFHETTPERLIEAIKPDVIVKGGDYEPQQVVGYGTAQIVIIPRLEDYSTTGLISY